MVSFRFPAAFLSLTALKSGTPRRSLFIAAVTSEFLLSNAGAQVCSRTRGSREMTSSSCSSSLGYLDAQSASALDNELMSSPGFCLEQLMELAGLSVAEAVYQVVQEKNPTHKPHILVVSGPGNNGGDGLVAARHLVMFGYDATILYPKQSKKQHFINLVQQCHDVGIQVVSEAAALEKDMSQYSCIVDSIFGFSFEGEPREPFKSILEDMKAAKDVLTVAVDVPSGWNVDEGDISGNGFIPNVLISLTAPKLAAKSFVGRHFVGGRFLPPKLADKYNISMPDYPGVAQVVEV